VFIQVGRWRSQGAGPAVFVGPGSSMDSQTLELVGQHRLASELLLAGLEVAFPARDRGVDLIAYSDVGPGARRFVARPIQLKAASRRSFGIWKKYEKIHDLVIAFVWHVNSVEAPETYALTYGESVAVGEALGWTKTASWVTRGGYGTTRPSAKLRGRLEPYRMTPERWRTKILGAS
jgi:hypothetical protein